MLILINMINISKAIEEARAELVTQELRCKDIRRVITHLEAAQRRYDSTIRQPNGQNVVSHAPGLTDAVRHIFEVESKQEFCTARVRELLQSQGFDTRPRVFSSALSTVLTRLGKNEFITITTDGEGNRTYKRKAEMV
jgi:hypothetical protein